MSEGVRLGAFGWGMHEVRDSRGESKRRAVVVVMENDGRFAVVFGRSDPPPGHRTVKVAPDGDVGRRMGLRNITHFTADVHLLPSDYEIRGYFAVQLGDERLPDAAAEYDLWLAIRGLAAA